MNDRIEEEHVAQFHGRIDEKFAEWEIDVKLWELSTRRMTVTDWDRSCIEEACVSSRRLLCE